MSRCQDFCEVVNYLNGSGFMTLKSGGVKIEEKIKKKGGGEGIPMNNSDH